MITDWNLLSQPKPFTRNELDDPWLPHFALAGRWGSDKMNDYIRDAQCGSLFQYPVFKITLPSLSQFPVHVLKTVIHLLAFFTAQQCFG